MVIFDKLVTERRPTIGSVPPRRGLPPFGRAPCLPWQDSHLFAGEGCSASPLSITRKDRPTPGVRLPCTRGRNYNGERATAMVDTSQSTGSARIILAYPKAQSRERRRGAVGAAAVFSIHPATSHLRAGERPVLSGAAHRRHPALR